MPTDPTPEAYEAAARAVAAESPARRHGQLCPCARSPLANIGLCDCWILPNARHDARFAVDAVWPIAEATVRAQVAAEIRAACECATSDDQAIVRSCEYDRAARIAEGSTDE